jgi:hypothetical protein
VIGFSAVFDAHDLFLGRLWQASFPAGPGQPPLRTLDSPPVIGLP